MPSSPVDVDGQAGRSCHGLAAVGAVEGRAVVGGTVHAHAQGAAHAIDVRSTNGEGRGVGCCDAGLGLQSKDGEERHCYYILAATFYVIRL